MAPVCALAALLLLALPATAAEKVAAADADSTLPSQLTLAEALRIFRARGFNLLLADAQVASARGDVDAAGASPNPSISGSLSRAFGYDASQCAGCSALGFSVGLSEWARSRI